MDMIEEFQKSIENCMDMDEKKIDNEISNEKFNDGCDVLRQLWITAKESCRIAQPGVEGTVPRGFNFIACGNMRDFMVMASLKCWEERGSTNLPPVVVTRKIDNSFGGSSSNKAGKKK